MVDDLARARGVLLGVALGAVVWAVVIWAVAVVWGPAVALWLTR